MGLDMYLEAKRTFYNANYMKNDPKYKSELDMNKNVRAMFPEMFDSDNLGYVTVTFEAGYWRKSNAIHKWFVDNCQDGEDNCQTAYVDRDQLKQLKKLCEEVIEKSKLIDGTINNGYSYENGQRKEYVEVGKTISNPNVANELLPTQSGFFFGNTDYDEYYISDLEQTVEIIDKCLKLPEEWSFYYHSSW